MKTNRLLPLFSSVVASLLILLTSRAAAQGTAFKDTSVFKPLPGHPVVLYEWEDMECPLCAHVAPIVMKAIATYRIPYERHDFLIRGHVWSKQAAITARYLQDKINPAEAEDYRQGIFASQKDIDTPDDLVDFTHRWFVAHHLQVPLVMDPDGLFSAEVQADVTAGEKFGLKHTPTIVVVGPEGFVEVKDISKLSSILDTAQSQVQATQIQSKPQITGKPHR